MKKPNRRLLLPFMLLTALVVLSGCGGGDSESIGSSGTTIPAYGPSVALTLPETMTGGQAVSGGASVTVPGGLAPMTRGLPAGGIQPMAAGGSDPCAYLGHGNGDPFRNGHTMTKFLVGAIASWSCIADNVIRFVDILVFYGVPTDGTPFDIVANDPGHQAGDPIFITIDDDPDRDPSTPITEVRLFWSIAGAVPVNGEEGFFLAWDTTGGNLDGRLIVDVIQIADTYNSTEDPKFLRLDFNKTGTLRTGDMYLGFDPVDNPWVRGWHINVEKQSDGSYPKYKAMGVIDTTGQWDARYLAEDPINNTETPQLNSFAVADNIGTGAAIAQMADLALVLSPVDTDNDHLGTFLFTKEDRYYFGGGPPVVYKNVTTAVYKTGSQSIMDSSPDDYIRSAADVDGFIDANIALLGDPVPYNGTEYGSCTSTNTGCDVFLNALFASGDFGAEGNQGTEPGSGDRRTALNNATWFNFACPNPLISSCVWDTTDVFAMSYGGAP